MGVAVVVIGVVVVVEVVAVAVAVEVVVVAVTVEAVAVVAAGAGLEATRGMYHSFGMPAAWRRSWLKGGFSGRGYSCLTRL